MRRIRSIVGLVALVSMVLAARAAEGGEPKVEDLEGLALKCDGLGFFALLETLNETVNVRFNELTAIHSVVYTYKYENPPLRKEKCHALLKTLIERGAEVDARSTSLGYSPLYFAAKRGRTEVVRILLDAGANVDIVTKEGTTPLHIAALEGHRETVEILLDAGADPHVRNCHRDTPRDFAHWAGNEEVEALLKKAEKKTKKKRRKKVKYEVCRGSAMGGTTKAEDDLEAQRQKEREKQERIEREKLEEELMAAAKECDEKEARKLAKKLDSQVNFRPNRYTPLFAAVISYKYDEGPAGRNQCVATVSTLIRAGADLNITGAADDGDFILETPLMSALRLGRADIAEVLMKAKPSVNDYDLWGVTALHLAALAGDSQMVKTLLAAGAMARAEDCHRDTARDFARWAGFDEVATLLADAERASDPVSSDEKRVFGICPGSTKRGKTKAEEEAAELAHRKTLEDMDRQADALAKVMREMSQQGLITKDEPKQSGGSSTNSDAPTPAPEETTPAPPPDPCSKVSIYTTRSRIKKTPTGPYRVHEVIMTNDSDENVEVKLKFKGKRTSTETIRVPRRSYGKEYQFNLDADSVSIDSCRSK